MGDEESSLEMVIMMVTMLKMEVMTMKRRRNKMTISWMTTNQFPIVVSVQRLSVCLSDCLSNKTKS